MLDVYRRVRKRLVSVRDWESDDAGAVYVLPDYGAVRDVLDLAGVPRGGWDQMMNGLEVMFGLDLGVLDADEILGEGG